MCHAHDLEEHFGEGLAAAGKRKSMAAAVLDSEGWVKLAVLSLAVDTETCFAKQIHSCCFPRPFPLLQAGAGTPFSHVANGA